MYKEALLAGIEDRKKPITGEQKCTKSKRE